MRIFIKYKNGDPEEYESVNTNEMNKAFQRV